jgi:hypothetical protein
MKINNLADFCRFCSSADFSALVIVFYHGMITGYKYISKAFSPGSRQTRAGSVVHDGNKFVFLRCCGYTSGAKMPGSRNGSRRPVSVSCV